MYAQQRKNFYTDWNGKQILRTLKRVNPNFYPKPYKHIDDVEIEDVQSGFLTQDEYSNLYDDCSEMIHVNNPFSEEKNPRVFLQSVSGWLNKIIRLLNHHRIQLINTNSQLWILMKTTSTGNVQVVEFQEMVESEKQNL